VEISISSHNPTYYLTGKYKMPIVLGGGGGAPAVTHYVYQGTVPGGAPTPNYTSIAAAITAASAGDTVQVAAGTFNEAVIVNKAITLRGAGASSTTITQSGTTNTLRIIKAGAVVQDMTVAYTNTNTTTATFVCIITRESLTVDANGIQVSGVTFSSTIRGVAVNGVGNISFTNCVFPLTANYSIGLGSVKGCVFSGCTIPGSSWGSVGVFPSDYWYGVSTSFDIATSGIDLTDNNTFTSQLGSVGVVQVQRGYGPEITYGFSTDKHVRLPSTFEYSYLQQVKVSGSIVGAVSVTVSNVRIYNLGSGVGAQLYTALQGSIAAAVPGGRAVVRGVNMVSGAGFIDSSFDAEDEAYMLSFVTATITSNSSPSAVVAAMNSVEGVEQVADIINSVIEVTSVENLGSTLAAMIAEANRQLYVESSSEKKEGLAAANIPSGVVLTAADTAKALENHPAELVLYGAREVPAVTGGLVGSTIILPAPLPEDKMVLVPAMVDDVEYTLLVTGESSHPGGVNPVSKVKYNKSTKVFEYKASSAAAWTVVPIGGSFSVTRGSTVYTYPLVVKGSFGTASIKVVPCLPTGQRIMTPAGWRAVEELRTGDLVVTDRGVAVPAKIHSTKTLTTSKNAPITIAAGALGRNYPKAPIRLSPLHAVRLSKGIWEFPQNMLRRGWAGVTQDAPGQSVTYYHVELPNFLRDNLVLEGGAVAESYGKPYVKAHGLLGKKLYTYSERLGGYTRMAEGSVAAAKKTV
jgi:Hint domain